MLYYAAADKNHWGVLCRKISSSDTATMQGRFWQKQCTWWKDQFWKTGSVADDHKGWHCSSFGIIPENIQNLRECHEESPENQHAVSHKKLAYWENHFWESSMMTLSSFPIKFRSCRGKLIKIKQDEKRFVNISFKGLKMTLACWIWMIWTILTTVAFVWHLLHLLSPQIWPPNVELTFYQVHCSCQNLSCIAAVSEELILWQSTPW